MSKATNIRGDLAPAGISGWGSYIPSLRATRAVIAEAWGGIGQKGVRSVAGADEDSVTLAVEAGAAALRMAAVPVDSVMFASTTSPYLEKQAAVTVAKALGLRGDVATSDTAGSLRAGTTAMRMAFDSVRSGSSRGTLVVAADVRPAEPGSADEMAFGDAAAAVIIAPDAPIALLGAAHVSDETIASWRRPQDQYVRTFEARFGQRMFVPAVTSALRLALENSGVAGADIEAVAGNAPDRRALALIAGELGIRKGVAADMLLDTVGHVGAAHSLLALCEAIENAQLLDHIAVVGHGEGADAMVFEIVRLPASDRRPPTVREQRATSTAITSYTQLLRTKGGVMVVEPGVQSSPIIYMRDIEQEISFMGHRCRECGEVQFPAWRVCRRCGSTDRMDSVQLGHRGTIFTYTLDHLHRGRYLAHPIAKTVVDLDGGGRVFLELTDGDPSAVEIGGRVQLTFRMVGEAGGYQNYYWKARPLVTGVPAASGGG